MVEIKFGTDGWRAIIAKEYTVDNVERVADATGRWMQSKGMKAAVIGYDCRFGGVMFAEATARVLGKHGIKVYLGDHFASTPMVSYAVTQLKADMGIVITASHNPSSYNGYKLKSSYGGPTIPGDIAAVEALIPEQVAGPWPELSILKDQGLLEMVDLEAMYIAHVECSFDLDAIRKSGMGLAYDAMFGAGQNVIRKVLPEATLLHCDFNPSFEGTAPEPIDKNLQQLAKLVASDDSIEMGLATDGDADRIGMYNSRGEFVDSHRILLLLLHYLVGYKKMTGKVVITFSVTEKVAALAEHYGLDYDITKIGFKYITEIMQHTDVVVAGEESGGIAIKGHIPERDGIWMGLTLLEFMAKTGKTLDELLAEVYDIVGAFDFGRNDLHVTEAQKQSILKHLNEGSYKAFGPLDITKEETIDGYKFHFAGDKWVMIRPSGTEPVLRVYAQAPDMSGVQDVLDNVCAVLLAS